MIRQVSQRSPHPLNSLLILLGLVFLGAMVGGVIGVLLGVLLTGISDIATIAAALTGDSMDVDLFRIVQGASSVGMFVLPPLFLGLIEHGKWAHYVEAHPVRLTQFGLVLLLVFFSGAITDALGTLNNALKLPDQWHALEAWMQAQEKQIAEMTLQLLRETDLSSLLANLLVMAAIPALGEELLFRGALQSILLRWLRNPHVAIWVTAVIFSAIHLQFYGFLPRLYLGALFGYLFFWSKNIWIPVFAHFLNNAFVIFVAYFYQHRGQPLDSLNDGFDIPGYVYFISFVAVSFAVNAFYVRSRRLPGMHSQSSDRAAQNGR